MSTTTSLLFNGVGTAIYKWTNLRSLFSNPVLVSAVTTEKTVVIVWKADAMSPGLNNYLPFTQLSFVGPPTGTTPITIQEAWLGCPSTTGKTWEFSTNINIAPVQITVGGNNSFTIPAQSTGLTTDPIAVNPGVLGANGMCVAFRVAASSPLVSISSAVGTVAAPKQSPTPAAAIANFNTYTKVTSQTITSCVVGTGVFTKTAHGLLVGIPVKFTGGWSGGPDPTTTYYVNTVPNANTFTVSETFGGSTKTWTGTSGATVLFSLEVNNPNNSTTINQLKTASYVTATGNVSYIINQVSQDTF